MKKLYTICETNESLITDITNLAQLLEINPEELSYCVGINDLVRFPLKVPSSFVARMSKKNLNDPLLLQILPQAQENAALEEKGTNAYTIDPLQESQYQPLPGLIHKYYGRVLLLLTNNCPINCRFCFRRHIRQQVENWTEVLTYLAQDNTISEVILSGGEPLLWSNSRLEELLQKLSAITHIKYVRIHTRAPLVMPERIDDDLLSILAQKKLSTIIFVIHCNHSQEIDDQVAHKLKKLRSSGFTLLNQSVLLKGINDDVEVLIQLSERLCAAGVLPYYLHMLDKVKGAECFYVDDSIAKLLLTKMQEKLPGYLVPRLVRDVAGEKSKVYIK